MNDPCYFTIYFKNTVKYVEVVTKEQIRYQGCESFKDHGVFNFFLQQAVFSIGFELCS